MENGKPAGAHRREWGSPGGRALCAPSREHEQPGPPRGEPGDNDLAARELPSVVKPCHLRRRDCDEHFQRGLTFMPWNIQVWKYRTIEGLGLQNVGALNFYCYRGER